MRLLKLYKNAENIISTQYTILGVLKNLYPSHFHEAVKRLVSVRSKKEICHKLNGKEEILSILQNEPFVIWKLREICQQDRASFLPIRKKYLNPNYN